MFNRNVGIILLIALAAGLGLLAAQQVFAPKPPAGQPATEAITLYPQPRTLPDYNLAQSDGTRLIPGELKGHWTLVFLGFTFCPDVCPTTLAELAGAQNQWEALPDGLRPRVLFVSVDPERDTPKAVSEYVRQRRLGAGYRYLIGTRAELEPVWRDWHIAVLPGPKRSVTHTTTSFLVDPRGRLRLTWSADVQTADVVHDLALLLDREEGGDDE